MPTFCDVLKSSSHSLHPDATTGLLSALISVTFAKAGGTGAGMSSYAPGGGPESD
eukprot:CAMPEP_0204858142 /NCGR_PEP_ID=MMETSP1347-20130617/21958_1 /ASSEMBLY_ACC=CAM_ASM_000690 /TAXON_ID=215587 /ORGANISM="Aplanochytrium stocchinoi, Strain GSBS06" /LENGTH=54 /DNA_ID=CAMNT_0052006023 /DNA_START=157 /DNA_END=318 /DNA_ORIENTATION=-